eukprot:TRINITY_DN33429_c0_g1_i1.p1 TRINITY_DN33429_c0_g1~~TRINITY_DN33429_c0_g1_i1.p1  ORF type:complete len:164 (-),score=20.03 TRINITY_DN33429_c0_g1_i1:155-646(-)
MERRGQDVKPPLIMLRDVGPLDEPPEIDSISKRRSHTRSSRRIAVVSADLAPLQDGPLAEWSRQKMDMLSWMDSWLLRQERLLRRAVSSQRDSSVPLHGRRDTLDSLPSLLTVSMSGSPHKLATVKVQEVGKAEEEDSNVKDVPGCIRRSSDDEAREFDGRFR